MGILSELLQLSNVLFSPGFELFDFWGFLKFLNDFLKLRIYFLAVKLVNLVDQSAPENFRDKLAFIDDWCGQFWTEEVTQICIFTLFTRILLPLYLHLLNY